MRKELGQETFDFLWSHDQQLLLSGAGVLQAVEKTHSQIPDYCVVVMPFAKTFEGFATKLAVLLGLVTEAELRESADNIQVGRWLGKIERQLPDPKRYEFVAHALNSAWHSRHKTIHADPQMPMPIRSLDEATGEIHSILRGMSKAHEVFVTRGIGLRPKEGQATTEESKRLSVGDNSKSTPEAPTPRSTLANQSVERFEQVDTECLAAQLIADGHTVERQAPGSTMVWQVKGADFELFCSAKRPGRVTVLGLGAKEFAARYAILLQPKSGSVSHQDEDLFPEVEAAVVPGWIGVDESGKGDVFGPLVVAGVFLTPDQVEALIRLGVRDSKTLGEAAIVRLSEQIKALCPHTIVRLVEPTEYNRLYEQFNNLNRLLAQQHAEVITHLHKATAAPRAISDQFGDERLIRDELHARSCTIDLEQRPHAEDDLAVAAASILARAAFVSWLERTSQSLGFTIPPGVAPVTIEAGRRLVAKRGRKVLGQYVKLHFRTVRAMH
jgi:ribonuclease HIII